MKAQHTHAKRAARNIHHTVEPEQFIRAHLTTKALSEDSCWDEIEAEYDDALSSQDISFLDDLSYN
jgi:hypothetical protein